MIPVIFENENFVVVDKPAGYLSVPGRFRDERPIVGFLLEKQLAKRIFPVHRLDFEVSGLLLFAKTPEAHSEANSWFEKKLVDKTYLALTTGARPLEKKFEWKAQVLRGKKRTYESPVGKPSLTYAEILNEEDRYLRWSLQPVTGRPHQLRFDLSRHGFPILGDVLYGSQEAFQPDAIALQAVRIDFPEVGESFGLPKTISLAPRF
jgi:tRNA pseudouridine32 synthase / 23S rRNA pseudouridine746 synthase